MSRKKSLAATIRKLILAAGMSVLVSHSGHAQVNYVYPHQASGENVSGPTNALDNSDSFAKVKSYGGLALGLGAYNGELDLTFATAIPANQTAYIRMGFNPDVLHAILGGGLGTVLSDILGSVILGNHTFEVKAFQGNTEVLKVKSQDNSSFSERARMVQNQHGHYLLALKPTQSYDRLRVTDRTKALLLGVSNETKVYSAFSATGEDVCNQELLTYYDANGGLLTLDALGLARGGVTNAYKAIDRDVNSFSEISLGLLAIAGEISQTIQLETPLGAEKQFHLVMQVGNPALLQLGLGADAIRVQALRNGAIVFEKPVNKDYLSLDLLGLLGSNKKARIPFHPNAEFDAVRIVLKSFVDLNLTKTTKIYDVQFSSHVSELALQGCGSVSLQDAIPNLDPTSNYEFFDQEGHQLLGDLAQKITQSGVYQIRGIQGGGFCPNDRITVSVTVLPLPTLNVTTPNSALNIGQSIQLSATSDSPVKWYDQQGVELSNLNVGPFAQAGSYSYTAIADNGQCENSATVYINVIDPDDCPPLIQRVYASQTSWGSIITGGVSNKVNAVDSNPQSHSTITTGLGLLGIGTTWQNLQWDHTIAAGTPVTIKLGAEYSGLALAGAISVVGTKKNSRGTPIDIGVIKPVSGALLNLLSGQNTVEYTFVPSNSSGVKAYDGVRISIGALLSVAQNTKVYGAYYHDIASQVACSGEDIQDILYGVVDLGVGALTATVGVADPWNVADHNANTYATLFAGVNVLAATEMTAIFHSPSQVGDTLRIDISKPSVVLTLGLIKGLEIQRFLGQAKVGAPIHSDFSLLDLRLLNNGTTRLLIAPEDGVYDRVRIRVGGVANVLDFLRVHQISRTANTKITGSDKDNRIEVCQGETISFEINDLCTTYKWYDQEFGGAVVQTGNSYTVPADLEPGTYKYFIQPIRYGCENYDRTAVTVDVKQGVPADAVFDVSINGGADLDLCTEKGDITLQAQIDPEYDNVQYIWYRDNQGVVELVPNATTASIQLLDLPAGVHTYYLGLIAEGYCETSVADRAKVVFTLRENTQASAISVSDTNFCLTDSIHITPTASFASAVFHWYFDNSKQNPIVSGSVLSGVAFDLDAQGGLTLTGVTVGAYRFYLAASSDLMCQNSDGALKEVIVYVSDAATPTTTATTQAFCLVDHPTIADLIATGTNLTWYSAPQGGQALDLATALQEGNYYASSKVGTCESAVRLKITVNLAGGDTATGAAVQDFCLVDLPTVSDIATDQTGVKWYTTATGGALISDQTPLIDQETYYGVLGGGTTCESSVRLAVTVNITDVATPTALKTTQTFCSIDQPKVSDLEASGTNLKWYNSVQAGVALNPNTLLVSGNTYYAVATANGCESSIRLAVQVVVNHTPTPTTTQSLQSFCSVLNPTIASLRTNENNVIWYSSLTGGTALAASTPLTSETTYYGALLANNCESATRLALKVVLVDAAVPTTALTSQVFCKVDQPRVFQIQTNETGVQWYKVATGGTVLAPQALLTTGTYYGVLIQNGCESSTRLQVEVTVADAVTPTTTQTTQTFCKVDAPTLADLQTEQAHVIWYSSPQGGTALAATTPLLSGSTYFGALSLDNCESSLRLAVDVIINDELTPTTSKAIQKFCAINQPTVADLETAQRNVVWYTTATGGQALAPTTALTDSTIYYAALQGANCESSTRLQVSVILNDAPVPTTAAAAQTFCQVDQPTLLDINTNETGVVWYKTPTGGTPLAANTALESGVYYGVLVQNGCESSTRLEIEITVLSVAAPTTTQTTQQFCVIDQPAIADLQTVETGVSWYVQPTAGVALPANQKLVDGITYYAAQVVNGCESNTRLAVTVRLLDEATPTADRVIQKFCAVDQPKVSDLQTIQSNVVWYAAATGGQALASTTLLTDNTLYFAALQGAVCQSAIRLQVSVVLNDAPIPTTTAAIQSFCQVDQPQVKDIATNESGVVWYLSPTGGLPVANNAALTTATYYGVLVQAGCESSTRLAIEVRVLDVATPTTTQTKQAFCLVDQPTVADLKTVESGAIWYAQATGGVALLPAVQLTDGTTYYAALVESTCESNTRLAVEVSVADEVAPTTDRSVQVFCAASQPTLGDLSASETNLLWYASETATQPLALSTALTNGTTYYAATKGAICESSIRLAVKVEFYKTTKATIAGAIEVCLGETVTYTAEKGMTAYVWKLTGGQLISGGTAQDNTISVLWDLPGVHDLSVDYTDLNGCTESSRTSIQIKVASCSDLSIAKEVDEFRPIVDENVVFTVVVDNQGRGDFTDVVVVDALPSGYQFVSYQATVGTYQANSGKWSIPALKANSKATLTIKAQVKFEGDYLNVAEIVASVPQDLNTANNRAEAAVEPHCLTIYNEFSPNKDGSNDYFRIDCIEYFKNNSIEIYNRLGSLVYSTVNYKNNWDGTSNVKGALGGKDLPDGTYYYVLDLGNGVVKKGWLYIIR